MRFIRHFKDVLRFNQLGKSDNQICFYCEGANYWPHLKPVVEALLTKTDKTINYVSSEDSDPGTQIKHTNFNAFVIGDGFIRNYFFDNVSSDLVIMTMPDLDQYQIKKSKAVKRFVYIHHSLVSHHMVYRPKAFDAFDVIFCSGPHHNREIEAMVKQWNMPPKQLVNHGYGRLDSIMANKQVKQMKKMPSILVAPTWGENGTIELMGERLIDALMALPYQVVLRPHPQTVKFSKAVIDRILSKHLSDDRFIYESGVSSETSLHQSDLMISDWSGAALEYAFGLHKPVLFIDVPKKIQNEAYETLAVEPFESAIRSQIGAIQSVDLVGLGQNIKQLLDSEQDWSGQLATLANEHVYNLGYSSKTAAEAVLELL
ncbi:CDP-glycerol glycerophosphotransferase family protein [Marinicella rhabdoformis]|uniref:CDP-glycerol glycerophosphotransferase family protein n=1 Tax=Marinicella rhabdoformis TaxID=2580566 RepID=UPI0012AEBE09|nr:CDP-glycerol glycerophosphotransferase family protein [Marinicella rhabdoformis]